MSMLRLPSLDRSSLGISKRLSLLSTNTVSSKADELYPNFASIRTLPSVECLDNDDFLNMFGKVTEELPRKGPRPIAATRDRGLPPELSNTPTSSRFPELHGTSSQRSELATFPMSPSQTKAAMNADRSQTEAGQMAYRSSVSSSIPSTKKSNASSRISRRSSVSSVTEDVSSSERSSKDSDQENALHERLKRRSREKRVSFIRAKPSFAEADRLQPSPQFSQSGCAIAQSSVSKIPTTRESPGRPVSRGKRLGQAMVEGLTVTSQSQTTLTDRPSTSPTDYSTRRSVSQSRRTSARLSRVLGTPPVVDEYDRIRVGIMAQLDNLHDLRSCAQISKDFYQTFHKYETLLVDRVLFEQSTAAWELRYSVRHLEKPSPFRLKSVLRDYATIQALEDFIIWRCQSILRPQSLAALLGEDPMRRAELHEAIWLVWSFANTFGKTSTSDGTLAQQIQWLNGQQDLEQQTDNSEITRAPCSKQHLEDMSEIWRCLETLLSGFKGREEEARRAGVFDKAAKSRLTDRELLTAWIHDILSLGPKAVLTLSSCDFDQARVLGITKWKPPSKGKSRENFLKAAVEEVYRDRLMKEARQKALDYRKSVKIQQHHRRNSSDPARAPAKSVQKLGLPQRQSQPLLVDTKHTFRKSMPLPALGASQSQAELRPDCDPLSPSFTTPILSPSSNPTAFQPLAMTKNVSMKLGPTLFPMQNRDQSHRFSIGAGVTASRSDHNRSEASFPTDPTDKAVSLLVREMGFPERDVKRALAMSDTGAGINVEAAVAILSADSPVSRPKRQSQLCELSATIDENRVADVPKRREVEVCEGNCKPILLVEPRRDRVSGLGMVKRGLSYGMSFRRSTKLSVIPDAEEGNSPPRTSNRSSAKPLDSTLTQLASSAMTTFTTPLLSQNIVTDTATRKEPSAVVQEQSPASPMITKKQDWLKPDSNPIAEAFRKNEDIGSTLSVKPRITLQRVGTGVKKTTWNIPGIKKKEHITEPEIIGYAY